jgi:hypothetical protein
MNSALNSGASLKEIRIEKTLGITQRFGRQALEAIQAIH